MKYIPLLILLLSYLPHDAQVREPYLMRWNGAGFDTVFVDAGDSAFTRDGNSYLFSRRLTTKRLVSTTMITNLPTYLTPSGNGSALTGLTASQVGLGNADNTSDAAKNAASATLTNKTISGSNNTLSNIPITAVTGYAGYTIQGMAANASTTTDAQTIYFGGLSGLAPGTTGGNQRLYIPRSGTIKVAYIYANAGTAGTNEAWVLNIRLNNTTNTEIQSLSSNSSSRVWSNTGLSISVIAGDYIEIQSVNPTWATNPANVRFGGTIYIE